MSRDRNPSSAIEMMDTITSTALEEICVAGPTGTSLHSLYDQLSLPSLSFKQSLHSTLLKIPTLKFLRGSSPVSNSDPSIQSISDAESSNLVVVADDSLRDCFVGVYDLNVRDGFKGFSPPQRRTLDRLAIARTNGITQNQLAKEFGMEGNEIFYVVKNLEYQGLVVRQSTVVKTKLNCNVGGTESKHAVSTNTLYLSRYAKHLGSQQRLEIIKDKTSESSQNPSESDAVDQEGIKDDVLINDYLPKMKAICDKLEEADKKVLVVKDIKRDLGYQERSGHRLWRYIRQKLKDAGLVEEFNARVNTKVVPCLRLLKTFSPKNFYPKTLQKCSHVTKQLVELPIEQQIYDIVELAGSKGLTIIELCNKLGVSSKKNYSRLVSMFSRFGMPLRAESHNRCTTYRVWTSRNSNSGSSDTNCGLDNVPSYNALSNSNIESSDKLALVIPERTSDSNVLASQYEKNIDSMPEWSHDSPADDECGKMIPYAGNTEDLVGTISNEAQDAQLLLTNLATEPNTVSLETFSPSTSKQLKAQSHQKHPTLTLEREQRILARLQEEKFVVRADLQRWLESLEKEKCTSMDRKTLIRILNNLQAQGKCKCIKVSAPIVTNYNRNREKEVVIHPSFQTLPVPEQMNKIYEKLRSLEVESRSHSFTQLKNDILAPVLDGIRLNDATSGTQHTRESMVANGYIISKMIRAKLLHIFLWGYLSRSLDWGDALSSGKHGYDVKNPHSICKLFVLADAIKAIPFELFLQVVGCAKKIDDMVEKCKSSLCLSDLTAEDYTCLMDTQATCRLSTIIDILQRLKLIRLVTDGNSKGDDSLHAELKYAMEIKPYIEEPCIVQQPSPAGSLDLRPQIRHDFMLVSREAVDDYWRTLEYCYSASDRAAAVCAFPGSCVEEVLIPRSWTSVKLMTAEKRIELFKRIMKDNPYKRLSSGECEVIAKDLDLSVAQVLLAYNNKRRQCLSKCKYRGDPNVDGEEFLPFKRKRNSSSRIRMRSSQAPSAEPNNSVTGCSDNQKHTNLSSNIYQRTKDPSSRRNSNENPNRSESLEEQGHSEQADGNRSTKSSSQGRFLWTEKADRQLVTQYVRHRVTRGAKIQRTDWSSVPDLPGPPTACKARMSKLNRHIEFRRSIMELCNMLRVRYAKHLEKSHSRSVMRDDQMIATESFKRSEHVDDGKERWDDFDNKEIKMAFKKAFEHRWKTKLQALEKGGLVEEQENLDVDAESYDQEENVLGFDSVQNAGEPQTKSSRLRLYGNLMPQRFVKIFGEERSASKHACESLAVSNAVELFKLIFLSTATSAEVPKFLAETLRRYSEHDLFAAFSCLREKRIMIGGTAGSPFELSQQFVQSFSSSQFPANTRERASNFVKWLNERENDLTEEEGVSLTDDLECGDVFHLFALVSSGELSIVPHLPEEGVGEAEDLRGLKRKADNKIPADDNIKRLKVSYTIENQMIYRREKGFPGITLNLCRASFSREFALTLFNNREICAEVGHTDNHLDRSADSQLDQITNSIFADSHNVKEGLVSGSCFLGVPHESHWEAMTCYAERLMLTYNDIKEGCFHPETFKVVFTAIQKAGDQGLSMKDVSEIVLVHGNGIPELIVEVLQAFGRVLKVNGYDSVRVVDVLYRSKYSLISVTGLFRDPKAPSPSASQEDHDSGHSIIRENTCGPECSSLSCSETDDNHRVTILNLRAEDSQDLVEVEARGYPANQFCQTKNALSGGSHDNDCSEMRLSTRSFVDILPWINGDGTINQIRYQGLVRRVLGIVMLNPGILEDDIICRMGMLNPQSCRKLLELLILDNHLIVRKMHQTTSQGLPSILRSLLGGSCKTTSSSVWREHFFANPMSTHLL